MMLSTGKIQIEEHCAIGLCGSLLSSSLPLPLADESPHVFPFVVSALHYAPAVSQVRAKLHAVLA